MKSIGRHASGFAADLGFMMGRPIRGGHAPLPAHLVTAGSSSVVQSLLCSRCSIRSMVTHHAWDLRRASKFTTAPTPLTNGKGKLALPWPIGRQSFSASALVSEQSSKPRVEESKPAEPVAEDPTDLIKDIPTNDLPSRRERQRWALSKQILQFMDELQPKFAIASQTINSITGTDYSAIESLRREIKKQEQVVRQCRTTVDDAKKTLDAAHAQQASSRKEVVGLLERKHSWSAVDLERYMALIRSEHTDDQAVRVAKQSVIAAEQALEEARTQLERRERAQYHEEQIWSDTIRRNSTWVTIGLVGFNVMLLLLSLVIIEPWRRRRLVREIRGALDEQKAISSAVPPSSVLKAPIEEAIDAVIEPVGVSLEVLETATAQPTKAETSPSKEDIVSEMTGAQEELASRVEKSNPPQATITDNAPTPTETPTEPFTSPKAQTWSEVLENPMESLRDLFSDRYVAVKKMDLTIVAVQGVAVGATVTAMIFSIIRRN